MMLIYDFLFANRHFKVIPHFSIVLSNEHMEAKILY